jgi:4-oxalmesaconate hydratase
MGLPPFEVSVLRNGYFDTCVYHQPGIDMLHEVVTSAKILFVTETVRAFREVDPRTGQAFDDTRPFSMPRARVIRHQEWNIF